jgi:hypothetical protein
VTAYNDQLDRTHMMASQGQKFNFGLLDGMASAASQTLRTLPTQSIIRGVQNMFDSSKKIDPFEANEQFGLIGEAQFGEEDEVTMDMANARMEDQEENYRANVITGIVNQESPVLGRLTQFASSIAAGFVDPAMWALNVGATVGLAKGIGAVARSQGVMNSVFKASPAAGEFLATAYAQGINRSFTQVAMREGAENFLAAGLEESVNVFGFGEERLARNVTIGESMMNVAAGGILGSGFGVALSREGRKSFSRQMLRKYGDDAPDMVMTDIQLSNMEMKMGVESSGWHFKVRDEEVFGAKDWQDAKFEQYIDNRETLTSEALYMPINEDGTVREVSRRGRGAVFTNNVSHAQNVGARVREVDASSINILKPSEFGNATGRTRRVKSRTINTMVENLVENNSERQMAQMMAYLIDPSIQPSMVQSARTKVQLKKELRAKLQEMTDLEDIIDFAEGTAARAGIDFDAHRLLDDVLEQNGYDGYSFTGRGATGDPKYNGLYVSPKATNKIKMAREFDAAKPSKTQEFVAKKQLEARFQEYVGHLKTSRESLEKLERLDTIGEKKPQDGLSERDVEAIGDNQSNDELYASFTADSRKRAFVDKRIQDLEAKVTDGRELTRAERTELTALTAVYRDKGFAAVVDNQLAQNLDYINCRRGTEVTVDKGTSVPF